MPLVAVFLPEGCLAQIIQHHKGPIDVNELFDNGERLHSVFYMEHFYHFERNEVKDKMCIFVDDNTIKLADNKVSVTSNESSKVLDFFVQLTQALVDTYLIVLLAIDELCGKPMVIPVKELI